MCSRNAVLRAGVLLALWMLGTPVARPAGASADLELWRLDCGKLTDWDKDVFGDGSVIMLSTPGHTSGHHSLLVRLPRFGPVILSGDLWHFSEQLRQNEMAAGTLDRAAELASRDRILKAVANLKATLVIEHELADISKLPIFPASAH